MRPRGVDHRARLLLRLDPVDRLLDRRVEVLDADRDAVEAERRHERDRVRRHLARIDLDRDLGIGRDGECAAQPTHQRRHFVARQERRRAATPVKLLHGRCAFDQRRDEVDLAPDVRDVLGRAAVVLREDLVACAVIADRVAERQVHVQRQRLRRADMVALGERVDVVGGREAVVEAVGGRIRRVARAEAVVLGDERRVEFENLPRAGFERHGRWSRTGDTAALIRVKLGILDPHHFGAAAGAPASPHPRGIAAPARLRASRPRAPAPGPPRPSQSATAPASRRRAATSSARPTRCSRTSRGHPRPRRCARGGCARGAARPRPTRCTG